MKKFNNLSTKATIDTENDIKKESSIGTMSFNEKSEINALVLNEDFIPVDHIFIGSFIVLEVGGTTHISTRVEPENATNPALRYVSLTPNIVSVDETTGLVTALAEGDAIVEIQATDGSGVTNVLWGVVHAPIGVPAIQAISDCYVRTDTVISSNTILKNASGGNVILRASSNDCVPLMETEKITVGTTDWYKVMYNGMVAYVTADSFIETTMLAPDLTGVRDILINTNSIDVAVRSTPFVYDTNSNRNLLGRFPHLSVIRLMNTTPQNGNWYAVYGKTAAGTYEYGWTSGSYLDEISIINDNALSQVQVQTILNNINNCSTSTVPDNKKDAAVNVAKTMLEYGYAPAFVAGMIANIISEGKTGQFESSNYGNPAKKPDYLVYMDTNYNGQNFYLNTYSGRTIMEFNVHSVLAMLDDLKTQSGGTWKIGTSRVGFGMGCIQWTFSRTYALVKLYLEINGNASYITQVEAAEAESIMIIRELSLSSYQNIVVNWRTACSNNLNTPAAAYEAGSRICSGYVRPANANAPAERGAKAQEIYAAMVTSI